MVCGIIDTTFEDGSVAAKDLNPRQGTGDNNEVARDLHTRSRVGSSVNPRLALKLEFRNAKPKARKSVSTGGTLRGNMS